MVNLDVVIPTYRRPHRCRRAVASVLRVAPQVKVIVVEQEGISTGNVVQSSRVKYIHLEKSGLPGARNVGILESTANIVLFMDDDAEMHPGCIEEHIRRHQSSPRIGIVAGRIRQAGIAQWSNASVVAAIDIRSGKTTGNFDLDSDGTIPYATGGHFSIKRSVLNHSGLFDTRFRGPALFEDIDFSLRVRLSGYNISYASRAIVTHYSDENGGCYEGDRGRRLLDRIHNHALFYARHVGSYPSREFLTEMRNVAEFASRGGTGGHSPLMLSHCFVSLLLGYGRGLLSRNRNPKALSAEYADISGRQAKTS